MPNKKLFIISDSPDIRSLFKEVLAGFSGVETTWLDTFFAAGKLLEQSVTAPFATRPQLIVIDPVTADFKEPHIQSGYAGWSSDILTLVLLNVPVLEGETSDYLSRMKPFDVLTPPLTALEIRYRLQAMFTYAENRTNGQFFKSVVSEICAGLLVLDPNEKIRWLNLAAEKLIGYKKSELSGRPLSLLLSESGTMARKLEPCERNFFSIQMVRQDGSRFWAGCMAGKICLPEGSGYTIMFTDFTEEKTRKDELLLSAKVFEFSGEAIMITDVEDRIMKVNEAFTRLTGYLSGEVIGQRPDFLNSGRQDRLFYDTMWAGVHRHGHWTGEVWNRLKDGTIRPMWLALTAVKNSTGETDHYITILSDITDRLTEEKHLRHLAQHDFLTGLPNRVLLKDRFSQAAANAGRDGRKIALLFLDLDKFKDINDRDGHTVGDQLLQQVAERLLSCLRSSDTACRWGGDEFVMLFHGIAETANISGIVEKISRSLRQPFTVNGSVYEISASIGVSFFPDHGADLDALLAHADAAMYSAKRKGGSFSHLPV